MEGLGVGFIKIGKQFNKTYRYFTLFWFVGMVVF